MNDGYADLITVGFLGVAIVVGIIAAFAIMYAERAAARAHTLARELEAARGDCIEWARRAYKAQAELDRSQHPIVRRYPRSSDETQEMDSRLGRSPRLRPVPGHNGEDAT